MEDTDYQVVGDFNQEEKRPTGLAVLCILTFIGSGVSFLVSFVSFALHDALLGVMEAAMVNMNEATAEAYSKSIDIFAHTPQYVFLISAVLYIFSISGAAIMLIMRRIGFHLYAIAQILIVFLPQLLNKASFNALGFFIAIAFIALYAIYYKKMK